MARSTSNQPRDATISMMWPPSPRTSSSVYSDSFSDDVAQDETIPILWQPIARPCSSVYSDNFSLEELVEKVDQSVTASQLDTIERLTRDNCTLREDLVLYRRTWHNFMNFVDQVLDLALQIRNTFDEYDRRITAAEEVWLASWGIVWI